MGIAFGKTTLSLLACACLSTGAVLLAHSQALHAEGKSDCQLDWQAGLMSVKAAAVSQRSAANPRLAGVRAEREARRLANQKLTACVFALKRIDPNSGNLSPLGAQLSDEDKLLLSATVKQRAREESIALAGDGSVKLRYSLPLEALRNRLQARSPQRFSDLLGPSAKGRSKRTATLGRTLRIALLKTPAGQKIEPALGYRVGTEDASVEGPMLFTPSVRALKKRFPGVINVVFEGEITKVEAGVFTLEQAPKRSLLEKHGLVFAIEQRGKAK